MKNLIPKKKKAEPAKKETAKKPVVKAKVAKVSRRVVVKKEKTEQVQEQLIMLSNLAVPAGAHTRKRILGRGPSSGHGKTSSRGSKGQTSRAGRDYYAGFEGGQTPLIRRFPKRGFTSLFRKEYQIVNLADLKRIKETEINLDVLINSGLIKDKNKLVKILGKGEIKKPISIQAHAFSKKAAKEIANAGGKIELINA